MVEASLNLMVEEASEETPLPLLLSTYKKNT